MRQTKNIVKKEVVIFNRQGLHNCLKLTNTLNNYFSSGTLMDCINLTFKLHFQPPQYMPTYIEHKIYVPQFAHDYYARRTLGGYRTEIIFNSYVAVYNVYQFTHELMYMIARSDEFIKSFLASYIKCIMKIKLDFFTTLLITSQKSGCMRLYSVYIHKIQYCLLKTFAPGVLLVYNVESVRLDYYFHVHPQLHILLLRLLFACLHIFDRSFVSIDYDFLCYNKKLDFGPCFLVVINLKHQHSKSHSNS